jgi:hypothetical protein
MRKLALALVLWSSVGCGWRKAPTPGGGVDHTTTPAEAVTRLATWGAWLAGVILLLGCVALFVVPSAARAKVLGAMGGAACLLVGAQLLYGIGTHLRVIGIILACVGLLVGMAVIWARRAWIERKTGLDLDRDGVVG